MFGKIKDKLKSVFSKSEEIVEENGVVESVPIPSPKPEEEVKSELKEEVETEVVEEKKIEEVPKKKGFFGKIFGKKETTFEEFGFEEPFFISGFIKNVLNGNFEEFSLVEYEAISDNWGGLMCSTKAISREELNRLSSLYVVDVDSAKVPYYFLVKDKNGEFGVVFSREEFIYTFEQAKVHGLELGLKEEHLDFVWKEIPKKVEKKKEKVEKLEKSEKVVPVEKVEKVKKEKDLPKKEVEKVSKVEEEVLPPPLEIPKPVEPKVEAKKVEVKKVEVEKKEEKVIEKPVEVAKEVSEEEQPKTEEKKGFFSKVFSAIKKKTISEEDFERIWIELEIFLLEINIAFEIVERIQKKLKEELVSHSFDRFGLSEKIREVLIEEIRKVLFAREGNLIEKLKSIKKPAKILILGVNGTGKTTSIAKLVYYLEKQGLKCVVSASDTFRAAAIEQLEEHSKKIGFKLIQHKKSSDPAAVAFDAVQHAVAKNLDVVIVDTAGRMPNNFNLIAELQKVKTVSSADMVIFIGDSISGNDLIEQITLFDKGLGIDGLILTKVDTDERPGSVVTTAFSIEKPIFFLGVGQKYEDLIPFDSKLIAEKLFSADKED